MLHALYPVLLFDTTFNYVGCRMEKGRKVNHKGTSITGNGKTNAKLMIGFIIMY